MTQQLVNVGASPNDNTGDFLRDAFITMNDNSNDAETRLVALENPIPVTLTYRKTYTAERNSGALGKMALGNGSTDPLMGAVITQDGGMLVSVGISSTNAAVAGQWDIFNNNASIQSVVHNGTVTVFDLGTPVAVNSGDYLNAHCINNGGATAHTVTFELEYEIDATGLIGPQGPAGQDGIAQILSGSGVPGGGLGNDGDAYFDNVPPNAWYRKIAGVWTFQANLQGDQGPAGASPVLTKFSNTLINNVNSGAGIAFSGFDPSALIADDGSVTVNPAIINVNITGRYELYFNIYMTAASTRTNVLYQFRINGVNQGRISGSDYIRNSSGHDEASTNLTEDFDLVNGDTIEIWCLQGAGAGVVTVPIGNSLFQIKRLP